MIFPESGYKKPVITLNNVVFPAPLGPIMPVIEFFGISKEKSSRAMVPSKFLLAFLIFRTGAISYVRPK
jgi:hypothetical protein